MPNQVDGSRRIRLAYFQQNLAVGACEDYLFLLMQRIDKSKFDVIFVCPYGGVLDCFAEKIKVLGIKVYRYPLSICNYIHLWPLFNKLKPDIVHFNDPCIDGIISARLARVPILVMTHHTPELNRRYNWKGAILENIAFRCGRLYIIFTSEYDRDTGIKKDRIPKNKSYVIYYGLPPERFNQRYDKEEVFREFIIPRGYYVIGSIARLAPQKGQKYFIEAASLVIEKNKSVRFFFVGEGELKAELKALVQEKGLQDYFVFTGHRNDIPRLLSAFDILVMPSLFEGLCFAVIEASAMGVPVIASNVGGMRRSVMDAKTGILVPPSDPVALATAILRLLGDPQEAKDMGLAGQKYFKDLFTQERMVKETEKLYATFLIYGDSVSKING